MASMVAIEAIRAFVGLPDGFWVFGFAMIGAAAANWFVGRKLNRKSFQKVRTLPIRERLIYRARHKFMSVPMESFSLLMAAGGLAALIAAATNGVR